MIYPENLIPFSIIGIGYSAKEINSINNTNKIMVDIFFTVC